MNHDGLAIGGQSNIEFPAVGARLETELGGFQGILGRSVRIASMCEN
jgi:hypothetical protein